MKLSSVITLIVLLVHVAVLAETGDSALTLSRADTARLWQITTKATRDLEEATSTCVIKGVPFILSSSILQEDLAVAASLVWFYDLDEELSGNAASQYLTIVDTLTKSRSDLRKEKDASLFAAVWTALIPKYNADRVNALQAIVTATGQKIPPTSAEIYGQTIRSYAPNDNNASHYDRMTNAILGFAGNRDLDVKFIRQKLEWRRCTESIIRRMPFIIDDAMSACWLCVGYLEVDEQRYLIALNPSIAVEETDLHRKTPSKAQEYLFFDIDEQPLKQTVFLRYSSLNSAQALFVTGWRRNQKRFGERLSAILTDVINARKTKEGKQ